MGLLIVERRHLLANNAAKQWLLIGW